MGTGRSSYRPKRRMAGAATLPMRQLDLARTAGEARKNPNMSNDSGVYEPYYHAAVQLPFDLQSVLDATAWNVQLSTAIDPEDEKALRWRGDLNDALRGYLQAGGRAVRRLHMELSKASANLLGGRPVRFQGCYFVSAFEAAWTCTAKWPCRNPERLLAACHREIIEVYRMRKRRQRRTLRRELIETPSEAVEAFLRRKQWANDPTAPALPCPVKRTDGPGTWLVRSKPKTLTAPQLIASINALIDAYPRALTGPKLKGARGVNGGDPGSELRKLARRDTDWRGVLLFPTSTCEHGTRSNGRKGYGINP